MAPVSHGRTFKVSARTRRGRLPLAGIRLPGVTSYGEVRAETLKIRAQRTGTSAQRGGRPDIYTYMDIYTRKLRKE